MKALIDLDILTYELGGAFEDSSGRTITDPDDPAVMQRVYGKIQYILRRTEASGWQGFLTNSESNFRLAAATLRPYKGTRKSEKPIFHKTIRYKLNSMPNVSMSIGQEADDDIGIYQAENGKLPPEKCDTIICSRDKDLRMIPGWHFGWKVGNQKEYGPVYLSQLDCDKNFYCQVLTGDTSDNIPGLYGVGPKSACVKKVQACTTGLDMESIVIGEYKARFDSAWQRFYNENHELLWIRRHD